MNSDLEKIKKLRSELHYHNYLYYNLNKPIISDFEFDNKLKNLIELEENNPVFFDKNSPTQRVGDQFLIHLKLSCIKNLCIHYQIPTIRKRFLNGRKD